MGAAAGRGGVARVWTVLSLGGGCESPGSGKYSKRGGGDARPGLGSSGVSAHTHRRRAGLPGRERAGHGSGSSCGRRTSEEQRRGGSRKAVSLLRRREMSGLSPKSQEAPGEYWNTPERCSHAASGGCSGPPGAFSSCRIFWKSVRPVVPVCREPPAAESLAAACQRGRHSWRLNTPLTITHNTPDTPPCPEAAPLPVTLSNSGPPEASLHLSLGTRKLQPNTRPKSTKPCTPSNYYKHYTGVPHTTPCLTVAWHHILDKTLMQHSSATHTRPHTPRGHQTATPVHHHLQHRHNNKHQHIHTRLLSIQASGVHSEAKRFIQRSYMT